MHGAMVDSMTDTEIRFERPPVRTVELTLYFDEVPLRLTNLATLLATLTSSFPLSTERFALMPWTLEGSEEPPPFIDEGSTTFPFPLLTFSNEDGHSVSFQGDRFQVRWEFGDDRTYPGYLQLREELMQEFERFTTHVASSTEETVQIRQARAEYENVMPNNIAWISAQRTRGVDDLAEPERLTGLTRMHTGGQFTFTSDPFETKVDFAAVSYDDLGRLSLRGTTGANGEVIDPLATLDATHGHLLNCFTTLTASEQQEAWGRK